jgi:hypothetical protein
MRRSGVRFPLPAPLPFRPAFAGLVFFRPAASPGARRGNSAQAIARPGRSARLRRQIAPRAQRCVGAAEARAALCSRARRGRTRGRSDSAGCGDTRPAWRSQCPRPAATRALISPSEQPPRRESEGRERGRTVQRRHPRVEPRCGFRIRASGSARPTSRCRPPRPASARRAAASAKTLSRATAASSIRAPVRGNLAGSRFPAPRPDSS